MWQRFFLLHLFCFLFSAQAKICFSQLYNTLKLYNIKGWPTKKQKSKKTVFYNYVINSNHELIQQKGDTIPAAVSKGPSEYEDEPMSSSNARRYSSDENMSSHTTSPDSPFLIPTPIANVTIPYGNCGFEQCPCRYQSVGPQESYPTQKVVLPSFSELLASIQTYNRSKSS